jgi:hydroxylaminobenzene mutase
MNRRSHLVLELGVLLILIGLSTGLAIPLLAVPRLGLSAHILGVMSGMLLATLGLVWPHAELGERAASIGAWLAIYSCYAGWLAPLLGGITGAGASMLPIASGGLRGSAAQEAAISFLLGSAAVAIVVACGILFVGLRRARR